MPKNDSEGGAPEKEPPCQCGFTSCVESRQWQSAGKPEPPSLTQLMARDRHRIRAMEFIGDECAADEDIDHLADAFADVERVALGGQSAGEPERALRRKARDILNRLSREATQPHREEIIMGALRGAAPSAPEGDARFDPTLVKATGWRCVACDHGIGAHTDEGCEATDKYAYCPCLISLATLSAGIRADKEK